MSKKQTHQRKVIQEIIDSEFKYDMGLQYVLVSGKHIQEKAQEKFFQFSNSEFLALFPSISNIHENSNKLIMKFHNFLISEKNSQEKGVPQNFSITDCFLDFDEILSVYFQYIPLFDRTIEILRQERKLNHEFNEYLDHQEKTWGDTIDSFLITPIQRPPRYQLLVRELIKFADENSSDKEQLEQIYNTIVQQIEAVDDKVAIFIETKAMSSLQNRLIDFNLLQEGRRFFFYGKAKKHCRSSIEKKKFDYFK